MFALLKLFFVFIIVIFLVAVFFIFALVSGVISMFRKPKQSQANNNSGFGNQSAQGNGTAGSYRQQNSQASQKKKIIPQDEGEYVDFEEVE